MRQPPSRRPPVLPATAPPLFSGADHDRNARRVGIVIALTAATMVAEIVAGSVYGSMALVADGWHMATHAGAMLIAALAYRQARLKADDPRFTFGTGKFGDLAGFASAVLLALVALLIGWESLMRLYAPVEIDFSQAILVAVIGSSSILSPPGCCGMCPMITAMIIITVTHMGIITATATPTTIMIMIMITGTGTTTTAMPRVPMPPRPRPVPATTTI